MIEYPTKKTYKYIIESDVGYIVYSFKQASIQETYDYFDTINNPIKAGNYIKSLFDNIQEIVVTKKKPRYTPKSIFNLYRKKRTKNFMRKNLFHYSNEVLELIHKKRESKYTENYSVDKKNEPRVHFDPSIEYLIDKTKLAADKVYEVLTFEQLGRWFDKAKRDYYEGRDETRRINTKVIAVGGLSQEQKELLAYIKQTRNGGSSNQS